MSTFKNPVGPQSNKVYWRRRLIVGLGLIAVIVVIVLIVVRPGSSAGQPNDTSDGSDAQSTSSAPPTDAANPTIIPTEQAEAEGKACKAGDIRVTAITDHDHYAPGENPQLQLSIMNAGSKACVWNVGTSKQVYTITSGEETYWLSTDCQTDAVDAAMTLKPGVPVGSAAPITWDRTRSSADTCDSARDPVTAGGASYHLTVEVDGAKSESKQFILD